MPLIHFAFGVHHRAGEHEEQLRDFTEHILLPKRLRSFACPEFLPILNSPTAKWGKPSSAVTLDDGSVTFTEWIPSPPVGLLPNDVFMISFVNTSLRKLRNWKPAEHYGKLGIAFTDDFKRRNGIRMVSYYQYPNLALDPLVIAFNKAMNTNDSDERERLSREIIQYRKPAKLWLEIVELFSVMKITSDPIGKTSIEHLTYSRYDVGYAFQSELESRLVTLDQRDVSFSEADVLAIIVPDSHMKTRVEIALNAAWERKPQILEYPS